MGAAQASPVLLRSAQRSRRNAPSAPAMNAACPSGMPRTVRPCWAGGLAQLARDIGTCAGQGGKASSLPHRAPRMGLGGDCSVQTPLRNSCALAWLASARWGRKATGSVARCKAPDGYLLAPIHNNNKKTVTAARRGQPRCGDCRNGGCRKCGSRANTMPCRRPARAETAWRVAPHANKRFVGPPLYGPRMQSLVPGDGSSKSRHSGVGHRAPDLNSQKNQSEALRAEQLWVCPLYAAARKRKRGAMNTTTPGGKAAPSRTREIPTWCSRRAVAPFPFSDSRIEAATR